jgi:F-type H+-transporting ATPase subunit b
MLIDWFTVGAQALNFVILIWLMRRFLYQPILDAIDAREQRIATELADAERKQTEAQQERDQFEQKNEAFEQQRAALLQQAQADATAERQKLLQAARQAADALAAQRQAALASEAQALGQALRQRTQTEVFAIARRTLSDLATVSLEASACAVFIERLRALDEPTRQALGKALAGAPQGTREGAQAIVRSAFELPDEQRQAIRQAIEESLGIEPDLHFEVAPALVGGIELVAHGEKFAWTIADYLASLERGVSEVLKLKVPASTTP